MLRDLPDSLGTHSAHSSIEFLPVLPMDVLVSVSSATPQDVAEALLVPPVPSLGLRNVPTASLWHYTSFPSPTHRQFIPNYILGTLYERLGGC